MYNRCSNIHFGGIMKSTKRYLSINIHAKQRIRKSVKTRFLIHSIFPLVLILLLSVSNMHKISAESVPELILQADGNILEKTLFTDTDSSMINLSENILDILLNEAKKDLKNVNLPDAEHPLSLFPMPEPIAEPEESESTESSEIPAAEPSQAFEIFQRMTDLQKTLQEMTALSGQKWNVYVKDLKTGSIIRTGNQQLYAASLCKLYVMEYWEKILSENPDILDDKNFSHRGSLRRLLMDMIQYSDNDSYNILVQHMDSTGSFEEGCKKLAQFLSDSGYMETGIFHTLHPSATPFTSISDQRNYTTVSDCAVLLEKLYRENQAGNETAKIMMDFLLNQDNRTKIPYGIPKDVIAANKTGETDDVQHDTAIVYGPQTDYILCIMSSDYENEGDAIDLIQKLSSVVYQALNPEENPAA